MTYGVKKQVLLKVIWEERVAPRRIKPIANYWDSTALACWRRCARRCRSSSSMATAIGCRWAATAGSSRVFRVNFAHEFRVNPHFDLEPDYIIRKPLLHRILRYIPHREILSTFHTRVENRSVPWSVRHVAIEINGAEFTQNAENHARNSLFPLRHVDFHLTHECLGPPHSSRQTTARSLYALSHNDATKSPLVTIGRRKFTPMQTAPSPSTITRPPKSNTPIPSPTPLTTPNGIRIQSAILPQYRCADRQMALTTGQSH